MSVQKEQIPIVHKTYELYRILHFYQRKIPKSERYTLWQRCENTCLTMLEKLIYAGYLDSGKRLSVLIETSVQLDKLRILIRLALDIKIINQKAYVKIQTQTDEVGRMLGGWIKSLKQKNK